MAGVSGCLFGYRAKEPSPSFSLASPQHSRCRHDKDHSSLLHISQSSGAISGGGGRVYNGGRNQTDRRCNRRSGGMCCVVVAIWQLIFFFSPSALNCVGRLLKIRRLDRQHN